MLIHNLEIKSIIKKEMYLLFVTYLHTICYKLKVTKDICRFYINFSNFNFY